MADIAFDCVEKIVNFALAIKDAVETVKQNMKECRGIEKCADRSSALLKRLEEQTDMMKDKVMRDVLEDVAESLEEALALVIKCQQKHYVSHLWKAGDMAKELRRVQDDIVRKIQLGDFATNVQTTIMLSNIQNKKASVAPPPPTSEEVVVVPGKEEVTWTVHILY